MIQPAGYVRGLAEGLRRRVAIFEESPVLRIESGKDKTLHTPRGSIRTRNLLLTVNGQIESFGLFDDSSALRVGDIPISLNMQAVK